MTQIGISWLQLQETIRANQANEQIKRATLDEQHRSNVVNEGIQQGHLNESIRHNLESEQHNRNVLSENIRHNKAYEDHLSATLDETIRANKARESIQRDTLDETISHNEIMEEISQQQADTAETQMKGNLVHYSNQEKLSAISGLSGFGKANRIADFMGYDEGTSNLLMASEIIGGSTGGSLLSAGLKLLFK